MPTRAKKTLRPQLSSTLTDATTSFEEASSKSDVERLTRKLHRIFLGDSTCDGTAKASVRAQKIDIPLGRVRMCYDTILALKLESNSIVSLHGKFEKDIKGQIFPHKYTPFGVVEISKAENCPDKAVVEISCYEGYVLNLPHVFFQEVYPSESDGESLRQISKAKTDMVGTLVVDNMLTPCRNYHVLLDTDQDIGMMHAQTHILLRKPLENRVNNFSCDWARQLQNTAASFFECRAQTFLTGVSSGNAVLLTGLNGTGKSSVLKEFRAIASYATLTIDSLHSSTCPVLAFDEFSPLVVLFDDIDLWLSVKEFPFLDRNFLLRARLDEWRHRNVLVVMSVADEARVSENLKCPAYIKTIIHLPMPRQTEQRATILRELLVDGISPQVDETISAVALRTKGYSPRDLLNLTRLAAANSFAKKAAVSLADFESILKDFRPAAMGTIGSASEVPHVRWDDIGGQVEAKRCLQECVKWLTTHAALIRRFNVRAPRGILLYGPPGCSKTMLAKALANECRMHFVSIKGPELLSKWVGDSEKAIRGVFEKARAMAPAVLFFDEFDALCGRRSGWSAGDRVISQLLQELDGFHGAGKCKEEEILVVAATNRPDMIDPALLRPGRFDRKIEISPPNSTDREEILRLNLRNIKPEIEATVLAELAGEMNGFSGADCVAVCSDAAMIALQERIDAKTLAEEHLRMALRRFRDNRKGEWRIQM